MADLRPLTEEDLPALQAFLERCGDYYRDVEEREVRSDEALALWEALPPGKDRSAKHLFVIEDFAGVVDVVSGWPDPGTWLIGLLLLAPDARSRGLGREVVAQVDAWADAEKLRVAVLRTNPRGLDFWESVGFTHVPPVRDGVWALERLAQ
jgi:GNAT superfamily N-acetyltransferase